jgi:hypothetical protein
MITGCDPAYFECAGHLSVQRCRLADLITRTANVHFGQSREVVRGHRCCSRCSQQINDRSVSVMWHVIAISLGLAGRVAVAIERAVQERIGTCASS